MSVRNTQANDDIDLMSLFGALRRSLPKILLFSVLAGALTYGVLSMMAPRYTSEAQVAIASKRTDPFPEKNAQGGSSQDNVTSRLDREAINTHVKAIGAPSLLLKVAKDLKLEKKAEFNPAIGPVDTLDRVSRMVGLGGFDRNMDASDHVLEAVKTRLEVSAARESRFITVRFSATEPKLAAAFANRLAQTYRKSLVDVPVNETNNVVQALLPKIEELNKEVVQAEAELERFRARTGRLLTGPQLVPMNSQRLSALSAELSKAEAELSQAEARWRTAQELTQRGSGDVLPEVQQSNVIEGLINQRVRLERQINEASASLLPAHPRMKQLNADLAGLKRSIRSEISKVVLSLEKAYRSAKLRVDDIARQMSAIKTKVMSSSDDDAQVKILEARAQSKRAELDRLQRQLEDNKTLVLTKSVPVEAQIVSVARPSGKPTFPKKGPISALVFAATFLLGLAISAAREIIVRGTSPVVATGPAFGRRKTDRQPDVAPEIAEWHDDEADQDIRVVAPTRAAPAAAAASAGTVAAPRVFASRPADTSHDAQAVETKSPDRTDTGAPFRFKTNGEPSSVQDRLAAVTGRQGEPQDVAHKPGDRDDDAASMSDIAAHVVERAEAGIGFRTMLIGETDRIDPSGEAYEFIDAVAATGARVVLIDCSLDGVGLSSEFELKVQPGLTDLLAGEAGFEDVVANLPGTAVHAIACGSELMGDAELDADACNLVLDALDEAYDHIVVIGLHGDARTLFEAIQGRFDAGITICDSSRRSTLLDDSENSFLGFEVTDIDVIRYERSEGSAFSMRRLELGATEAAARS